MSFHGFTPETRQVVHEHLFCAALTVAIIVFGSGVGTTLGYLIRAGVLG